MVQVWTESFALVAGAKQAAIATPLGPLDGRNPFSRRICNDFRASTF